MTNPVGTKENRRKFYVLFVQSGFSFSCDESLIALDGLDIAEKAMLVFEVRDKLGDLAWNWNHGYPYPAWWHAYNNAASWALMEARAAWDKWRGERNE